MSEEINICIHNKHFDLRLRPLPNSVGLSYNVLGRPKHLHHLYRYISFYTLLQYYILINSMNLLLMRCPNLLLVQHCNLNEK